ncbi:MAG: dipeptidase, partial [Acidobacteriota bacterium]|nr:dipeptidase [Acidobacteriota bacterium]
MFLRKVYSSTALLLLLSVIPTPAIVAQTPAAAAPPARDEKLWKKALDLQRKSIVVDTHNDVLSYMIDDAFDIGTSSVGKYHTDIARMKQGGLTAEFFSVYIDRKYATEGGSARRALDMIDYTYRA